MRRVGHALLHMLALVFWLGCLWSYDERLESGDRRALALAVLALVAFDAPRQGWVGAFLLGGTALAAVYPAGLLEQDELELDAFETEPSVIPRGPNPSMGPRASSPPLAACPRTPDLARTPPRACLRQAPRARELSRRHNTIYEV